MYLRKNTLKWMWGLLVCTMVSGQAMAQDTESNSDWQWGGAIYMWGSNMAATTGGGAESEIPLYTILDNLSMVFMGAVEARKDKWSIVTDVIYLDLNAKAKEGKTGPGGNEFDVRGNVGMKSWIFTPQARYAVYESEKSRISVLAGLRYLDLEMSAGLHINDNPVLDVRGSNSNWDFIMGAQAELGLNDKWYVPIYVDVGAGDSARTWQGMAGVGYRFNKFNVLLTYRYLNYEFDRHDPLLSDMTVKGPLLGATFRFR